ncbi:MAG: hypothetical protein JXN61_01300 [Sedimentisphaerales bacterium]|nr:hypothetical protein [Sedimentisphaerales bacterium]
MKLTVLTVLSRIPQRAPDKTVRFQSLGLAVSFKAQDSERGWAAITELTRSFVVGIIDSP